MTEEISKEELQEVMLAMHKEMNLIIENVTLMRDMLVAIMEMLELDAPKRGT